MIFCHWHCFLVSFLFEPPTSKHSYHQSIYQRTSICTQQSLSSPGKFDEKLYLPLLYMLQSHMGMWLMLWNPYCLLRNTHELHHLLLRLVVVNIRYCNVHMMQRPTSQPQHHIKWMRRIPSICLWPFTTRVRIGMQSSNKKHFLGHFWSKSAAWQSPLMRGNSWATFGWSPLHYEVLQWGAYSGATYLVKICWMIKSSDEGHNFGPYLAEVCCVIKWSNEGHIFIGPHLAEVCCVTSTPTRGP